jgi:hypothetical protein
MAVSFDGKAPEDLIALGGSYSVSGCVGEEEPAVKRDTEMRGCPGQGD